MVRQSLRSHKDLDVYRTAFDTAIEIFELSKQQGITAKNEP